MKTLREIIQESSSRGYTEVNDEDARIFSMLKYTIGALLEKRGLLIKHQISDIMVRDKGGEVPAIKFNTKRSIGKADGAVIVSWSEDEFNAIASLGVKSKKLAMKRSKDSKALKRDGDKLAKMVDELLTDAGLGE